MKESSSKYATHKSTKKRQNLITKMREKGCQLSPLAAAAAHFPTKSNNHRSTKPPPLTNAALTAPPPPNLGRDAAAADSTAVALAAGATAESGSNTSGLGGLGLDGMVGTEPDGDRPALPLGEGNSGMTSGANAGGKPG